MPFNILAVYQRVLWYDWYFETITNIFKNLQIIAINLKLRKNKHKSSTKLFKFSLCNQTGFLISTSDLDRNKNSKSKQHTWRLFVGSSSNFHEKYLQTGHKYEFSYYHWAFLTMGQTCMDKIYRHIFLKKIVLASLYSWKKIRAWQHWKLQRNIIEIVK